MIGTHKAKLLEVGVKQIGQNNSLVVVVKCQYQHDGKNITRTGEFFMTEKAKPYTLDMLNTIGYQFQDDDMCDIDDLNAYDRTVEFDVVVEKENYTDKDGNAKTTEKIQFINPLGGRGIKNALASEEKVSVMKGLNLGGDVMSAREKYGKKKVAKVDQIDPESIPF